MIDARIYILDVLGYPNEEYNIYAEIKIPALPVKKSILFLSGGTIEKLEKAILASPEIARKYRQYFSLVAIQKQNVQITERHYPFFSLEDACTVDSIVIEEDCSFVKIYLSNGEKY